MDTDESVVVARWKGEQEHLGVNSVNNKNKEKSWKNKTYVTVLKYIHKIIFKKKVKSWVIDYNVKDFI